VKSEAEEGKQRHVLAPALLDNVKIPLGFRRTEAAKLYDWIGELDHPELKLLLLSIGEILRQEPSTAEIRETPEVQTPTLASPKSAAPRLRSVLRRKRVAGILLLSLVSVAIISTILVWRYKAKSDSSNSDNAPESQVIVLPTDPFRSGMIAIPGGTFLMGRNDGLITDGPTHSVTVSAFLMDRTEVANNEYASFVREMNYPPPSEWVDRKPPQGQEQWPVSNVSFEDVKAFVGWRSKRDGVVYRLPTEEEWEYAARGGDQNSLYPWSNNWYEGRAHVGYTSPTRIGSYPKGKNRWGVLDLIGNVWEWTSTRVYLYPGVNVTDLPYNEQLPFSQRGWFIMRGGSYLSTEGRNVTSALRDWIGPGIKHPTLGFRLVREGS
jgi:formylglycine-generating enzyme required for sulfatase activity